MENKVTALIASVLKVPVDRITLNTEIGEPDEWDSLHNMETFTELVQTYNVKITCHMLVDLEDVSDIVNLMKELTK